MKLQTFSKKFQCRYSKINMKITSCVRFELDAIFKDDAGYFFEDYQNCCGLSGGGGSVFLQEKLAVEEQKVEGTDRHATVSKVEYCAEEGVDGI